MDEIAALAIQQAYRGHQLRKEYGSERKAKKIQVKIGKKDEEVYIFAANTLSEKIEWVGEYYTTALAPAFEL